MIRVHSEIETGKREETFLQLTTRQIIYSFSLTMFRNWEERKRNPLNYDFAADFETAGKQQEKHTHTRCHSQKKLPPCEHSPVHASTFLATRLSLTFKYIIR